MELVNRKGLNGLAIVLSGGGAKGAFQVGVLSALISRKKVSFETAVGTSTFAMQVAAAVQDDIPSLVKFWIDLEGPEDIYKSRGGTLINIITGQPSLYTADPLRKLLKTAIDDQKIRASRDENHIPAYITPVGTCGMFSSRTQPGFRLAH